MTNPYDLHTPSYAAQWPTSDVTRVPITVPGKGDRIPCCRLEQIPTVIGEALENQDLGLIDQVVVRLTWDDADVGEQPATYTVDIVEFRAPSFPRTPYWFSQSLYGVIEFWRYGVIRFW